MLLLLAGCVLGPRFDQVAHTSAQQLKAETLALIDKSGEPYSKHKPAVEALTVKYAAASEAAGKVENNEPVVQAWQVIRGAQSGSAVDFFQTWSKRQRVGNVIRAERKAQISRHFDYLICLEASKKDGTKCTNPLGAAPTAPPVVSTEPEGEEG